jgi:hypothetical protein
MPHFNPTPPAGHDYGARYISVLQANQERERARREQAMTDPAMLGEIAREELADPATGRWRIGNIVDNFVTGVRQGLLLDNVIASDPEVQASTDLPVVRIIGLLGAAIAEGAITQSWMLRGLQAVAKTSKVPTVARAAKSALDGYLVGDDIDLLRKLGGHAALGAANEGLLHIAGGRSPGEALTAAGFAGAAGSVLGAGAFGLRAKRALRTIDDAGERELARGSFSKLREVVNEHARFEHAMRRYVDLANIEGRDYSDDWRLLKSNEVRASHVRARQLHEQISDPLNRSGDREDSWRNFLEIVQESADLGKKRIQGGDVVEAERELQARIARAPEPVKLALANHKTMVRELAEHARARIAPESEGQLTLFDAAGDALDDMDYAAMLADLDAMLNAGKRFHVQFLRRGSFIERKGKDVGSQNYLEMMHRASTRMEQDRLLEAFIEESRNTFRVELTPEQAREAMNAKKFTLPDGTVVKPFWARPGRIYPSYAVSEAAARFMDRARYESTRSPGAVVYSAKLPHAEPVWAIETDQAVFLPADIADRLTEKMVGKSDPTRAGGAETLHGKVIEKINKVTSAWKYNTILWGVMRFAGIQVIGDSVSGLRENPAIFLQRGADGKLDSPAVRALREIFRQYNVPMASQRQAAEAAIGSALGVAGHELVNDDATWAERAAAALAGAGLGYARATYRASREAMPQILQTARAAAVAGMPADFSVHVPAMLPAVASKLAKTRVVDEATGQAKVVFHGTAGAFDEFDEAFLSDESLYGRGFYFTEDPEIASSYTEKGAFKNALTDPRVANDPEIQQFSKLVENGAIADAELEAVLARVEARVLEIIGAAPNVRITRLRIENPFDIDRQYDIAQISRILRDEFDMTEVQKLIAERFPKRAQTPFLNGEELYQLISGNRGSAFDDGRALANQLLRAAGFDGITHIGGKVTGGKPHRVWIAFDKEQIFDAFDEGAEAAKPIAETYAARASSARYEAEVTARASTQASSSVYGQAESLGVIGSGGFAQETELARQQLGGGYSRIFPGAQGARTGPQRARDTVLTLLSGRLHGDPAQFANNWVQSVETVMNERENWLRLAAFMQQVEKGVDPRLAAKRARETFVDYGKFTEFEDKYLRGFLLPFYAFTRHNTTNWLRAASGQGVGGRPAVAMAVTGALVGADAAAQAWNEFFFGETEAQLAQWQRDQFHVIVGNPFTGEPHRDANGRPMVVATELGYEATLDLLGLARPHHALNMFGAGIPSEQGLLERKLLVDDVTNSPGHVRETLDGASKIFSRLLTPALRAPIELAANESWLYDAPIVPEQYVGTPEQHAFALSHLAKEALRQYREIDKLAREGNRGTWSPINSAFGLGLPIESVNVDANVRRHLHEQLELAQNAQARDRARWAKRIDDIVYSRTQWDRVGEDEQARLFQALREEALSPEERERAVRYYMERTSKSSVQRHWNTLNGEERARFFKAMRPADAAAFAFYVNGGDGLVQMAQR